MLQPRWMRKSLLIEITFAFGGSSPNVTLNTPARSTQSRLTITSAFFTAACASGGIALPAGIAAMFGWSLGNEAPILSSVMTLALSPSANATRSFQASTLREVRPHRMTMFFAPLRIAAAFFTASADGAESACGMKRAGSTGLISSVSLASCSSASKLM